MLDLQIPERENQQLFTLRIRGAPVMADIASILEFLGTRTPAGWLEEAAKAENLPILLNDHAACELKAAQSAQSLIWKYGFPKPAPAASSTGSQAHGGEQSGLARPGCVVRLLHAMSRLAREELRHFEQVLDLMRQRGIDCAHVSPARYAAGLRQVVRDGEPEKLVDSLIVGAFIEARSCERFKKLAPHLDEELEKFYQSLFKSEERHFQDYLTLAQQYSPEPIEDQVKAIGEKERELIESVDGEFRFHSGVMG